MSRLKKVANETPKWAEGYFSDGNISYILDNQKSIEHEIGKILDVNLKYEEETIYYLEGTITTESGEYKVWKKTVDDRLNIEPIN